MIHHGDLFTVLPTLEAESIDACVTDPPYELGFMGRQWDRSGVAFQVGTWREVYRVLKPGAHLVAFGGTRTFHRMTVAIEDAGFEIRDCLSWLYGSGFPKSLDVSKAIDGAAGAERKVVASDPQAGRRNKTTSKFSSVYGDIDDAISCPVTAPATDAAKQWQGWGTALKPAFEPVILARKPAASDRERDIILANLIRLEAQLWSLLPVSIAVEVFKLSQADYGAACGSAQWTADERRNTWADLFGQMDTLQSVSVMTTCLSTVTSWSSTLAECSGDTSTSTTRTVSSPTIDWRTLRSCLSVLTPATIVRAAISQPGSWWSALPAARVFHAAVTNLNATRELSALAPVIDQARISCQDADAPDFNCAWEPIILARKPLRGTVAANVTAYGTGALNIDACRIATTDTLGGGAEKAETVCATNHEGWDRPWKHDDSARAAHAERVRANVAKAESLGRWPANVCLDEPAAAMLDARSGELVSRPHAGAQLSGAGTHEGWKRPSHAKPMYKWAPYDDRGGASRFYYVAKPSQEERNWGCDGLPKTRGSIGHKRCAKCGRQEVNVSGTCQCPEPEWISGDDVLKARNSHPTVKPVELMRWLVRLVTPPDGTVLDPFMGSGTTGMACRYELRPFIGIEREAEYVAIAERRIAAVAPLFGEQTA